MEEKSLREQFADKANEMKEKYADVINDLCVRYDKDLGVGFEMLKAIARGGEYETEIEFDLEELKKDYAELVELSMAIAQGLN